MPHALDGAATNVQPLVEYWGVLYNFTATLPAPQSDLANYLLKDPYIFDLAGAKEKADERDIEEQLESM